MPRLRNLSRDQRSVGHRWAEALASFPVMAIGVTLLLRSEVGSSPFDALNTGIAEAFGVPLFVGMLIVAALAMALGVRLGGVVGPLTFVAFVGLGPLVNAVYSATPTVEPLPLRVLMFGVGLVLTVTGVALQVDAEVGPGPGEVLMLGLVKQGISVQGAKWAVDATVLVVGVALGGMFGVGTAVMMVAFAPMLALALRLLGYAAPSVSTDAVTVLEAPPDLAALLVTGPVPVTPAIIPVRD